MAETRGSIVCRLCGEGIVVTFHRVHGNGVHLAVADPAPLREHYAACRGMVGDGATEGLASSLTPVLREPVLSVPRSVLVGRIHQMLDMRAYVATAGSRSCTMCGMAGATCMALIGQNTREGCCRVCMDGNTHPAPGEAQCTCQQWAEAREVDQ